MTNDLIHKADAAKAVLSEYAGLKLHAIIAAIESIAPISGEGQIERGWQDIASAPSGSDILVYQPAFKQGRNELPARICFRSQAGHIRQATHWLPLPPAPFGKGE